MVILLLHFCLINLSSMYHEFCCTYSSIDIWGLGCLIWEAFNGPLSSPGNLDTMDQVSHQLYYTRWKYCILL